MQAGQLMGISGSLLVINQRGSEIAVPHHSVNELVVETVDNFRGVF
jgi:hypothetical protein